VLLPGFGVRRKMGGCNGFFRMERVANMKNCRWKQPLKKDRFRFLCFTAPFLVFSSAFFYVPHALVVGTFGILCERGALLERMIHRIF
jgi:hypothetical protein